MKKIKKDFVVLGLSRPDIKSMLQSIVSNNINFKGILVLSLMVIFILKILN